jgi:tetratricopeptide (TPR) repeat protein
LFQRDYMMRMIQQMTEAIAAVIGLRQRKEHQEALEAIDELLDRKLRLKASLVHALSEEDLIAMLTTNGVVDTVSLEAIARLLREAGDIYEERGDEPAALSRWIKALGLNLRLSLMGAEPVIADPDIEAEQLLDRLAAFELFSRVKRLLVSWHEQHGRFDQAENWLHELLEDGEEQPETAAAFYNRLLLESDGKLAAGGLPRAEVESGLADLLR